LDIEKHMAMIIEGRTITTLAELRSFVDAAERLSRDLHPHQVRLTAPLALRLKRIEGPAGNDYDLEAR
jgi:hypothetical protein